MQLLDGPALIPENGTPKRLVVLLHGLGADGNDLLSLGHEMQPYLPDTAFIAPNAPYACDMSPMGYQWFSLRSWSEDLMLAGAQMAAPILNHFLDEQLERFGLSDEQMAIIGFSQGTMMALHTALRRPNPCAAIIGYSGGLVGEALLEAEIQSRPPVCLIHGDADMVVPFVASQHTETLLKRLNVPVSLHRRPGLAHGIDHQGLHIASETLAEHFAISA